jgi:hypothetical protein
VEGREMFVDSERAAEGEEAEEGLVVVVVVGL